MGLSAPWADSLDIITFQPVKKWPWVKPMVLSVPWNNYIDIVSLHTAKINLQGLTQWALVPLGATLL